MACVWCVCLHQYDLNPWSSELHREGTVQSLLLAKEYYRNQSEIILDKSYKQHANTTAKDRHCPANWKNRGIAQLRHSPFLVTFRSPMSSISWVSWVSSVRGASAEKKNMEEPGASWDFPRGLPQITSSTRMSQFNEYPVAPLLSTGSWCLWVVLRSLIFSTH